MKNKTIIGMGKLLKSNVLLGASALGLLTSCGAYMNGYSETDGAYYDPRRDTVPQYDTRTAGNQVGGYYSYGDDEDESYDTSIVRQSQYNQKKQKTKYQNWGNKKTDSDWGDFTGTQTYYTDNSFYGGWGYPYGWGGWRSPFYGSYYGGGLGFGWGYPGWGWNIGFGWGGGYYPGWGMGGFYDPFWGYPYYAYRPHYWGGYYRPWAGGGYYAPRYRNRDADYIDRSRNGFRNNNGSYNNGSFRGNNGSGYQDRSNNGFRNSGFRDRSQNQMPQSQQGWNNRPSDSGFRSNNGFSTGGRGGGGFGGGSAGSSGGGGGGFRSGGRR